MKISTWNVNSIRARFNIFINWLKEERPDIVLLQELKCMADALPIEEIEDMGYNIAINGQKTYNGVAILSKFPLSDIVTNFPNNPLPEEARFVEALINFPHEAIRVASIYVPNGQEVGSLKYENKLKFFLNLTEYYKDIKNEKVILGGDFNVALEERDVYDPDNFNEQILFSIKERQAMRKLIAAGFIDSYRIFKQDNGYTWWDYRGNSFNQDKGARIDYLLVNPEASHHIEDCFISRALRGLDKASDHVPVSIIYKS